MTLSKLRGLGPKSAEMLRKAGINDVFTLRTLGPIRAFMQVRQRLGKPVSLNLLYALTGALEDRDWREIAKHERDALLIALDGLEQHASSFDNKETKNAP